jgi:hypothetical protein
MSPRIEYTDDLLPAAHPPSPVSVRQPAIGAPTGPAFADWDDPRAPSLLLYLAEEPEIGQRFSYGGATWEVVDYHDGWVARLVV